MSDKLKNIDRLEAALAKLDGLVADRSGAERSADIAVERDSLVAEVGALKQRNADLTAALKVMQSRQENLNEASQLVGDRLDGAIADIKNVLEG